MATFFGIAAKVTGSVLCGLIVGLLVTAAVLLAGGTREAADVVGSVATGLTTVWILSGK